jgi:hypothetical protein
MDRAPNEHGRGTVDLVVTRGFAGALVGAAAGAVFAGSGGAGRLLLTMLLAAYAGVVVGVCATLVSVPRARARVRAARADQPAEPDADLAPGRAAAGTS